MLPCFAAECSVWQGEDRIMKSIKNYSGIGTLSVICFLSVLISVVSANDLILTANSANIGNIKIVSPKAGSSAIANGTALLNTLAGIVDASSSNKYLIKIGPGTFDLGTSSLQMKAYVDIEGSGKELTVITSNANSYGTVIGVLRGSLRNLGINSDGKGTSVSSYGIMNTGGLLFVEDVAIDARNGTSWNIGIYNYNSNLELKNSLIIAPNPNGYAINNGGDQFHNNQILRSLLAGSTYQVNNAAGYSVYIAFTQLLTVSANVAPGIFNCFQNYNGAFGAATCP